MTTTLERLIADLIAHIEYPGSDYEYKRAPYADERLALAEQQGETVEPPRADWIEEARKRAVQRGEG